MLKKVFSDSMLLTLSIGGSQAISLLRNVIIARFLVPDSYGLAMIFAATVSSLELLSDLSLNKLAVQSKDVESPRFVPMLNLVNVARGILVALLLFSVAGPLANFINAPYATNGFRCLALVPIITSLVNLKVFAVQRQGNFKPLALIKLLPQLICLLLLWPLLLVFDDYWIIVALSIVNAVIMCFLSQWLTKFSYRWAFDSRYIGQILHFSWPLLINGMLMFSGSQADKFILGVFFSFTDVAFYSVVFLLTVRPAAVAMQVAGTLVMPYLATQQQQDGLAGNESKIISSYLLFAIMLSAGLSILGPKVLVPLFGENYKTAIYLIAYFSIYAGVWFIKAGYVAVLLSRADTKSTLIINLPKAFAIPIFYYIASSGVALQSLVVAMISIEVACIMVAVIRFDRDKVWQRLSQNSLYIAVFLAVAFLGFKMPQMSWLVLTVLLLTWIAISMFGLKKIWFATRQTSL